MRTLDDIDRRIRDCKTYNFGMTNADKLAHVDAPKMLAALNAVLVLAEQWRYKGEFGWGAWQEGEGPDQEGLMLDDAAAAIKAAISGEMEGAA